MYIKIKLIIWESILIEYSLKLFIYWDLLRIGYAIYIHEDEYNEAHGIRIARKRSLTNPFCIMYSSFNGEFNTATVEAIMNVKTDYIKNNFDKFIKKSKRRETNNP